MDFYHSLMMLMRWPHVFLAAITFCVAGSTVRAQASDERPGQKAAGEWSNDERIDALLDDAAAAERVRHRSTERLSAGDRISGTAAGSGAGLHDVIVGSRDPYLFFPADLFRHVVKSGYADDATARTAYRESMEDVRKEVGLPADFWEKLEVITAAYRADRAEELRIPLADLSEAEKRSAMDVNSATMCRDRQAAMAEATQLYGLRFRRFLYTAVAPTLTRTVLRKSTREELRALANGECE